MISLVFFYLSTLLFSGLLQFEGKFVHGKHNATCHDWAPFKSDVFKFFLSHNNPFPSVTSLLILTFYCGPVICQGLFYKIKSLMLAFWLSTGSYDFWLHFQVYPYCNPFPSLPSSFTIFTFYCSPVICPVPFYKIKQSSINFLRSSYD